MPELRLERSGSPTGVMRLLYRSPILLYRARLGFLFGTRFLMIEHIGRNTCQNRKTILEVVANHADAVFVAAGWGSESQWLKNVQANPKVSFHLGSKRYLAIAEMLGPIDARSVVEEYAAAHPRAFGRLAAFMLDDPGETSQIQARRVGEIVPIVRLSKTQ